MEFSNRKVLAVKPSLSASIILAVLALLVLGRLVPVFADTTSGLSAPTCSVNDLAKGTRAAETSISQVAAKDAAAQTLAQYAMEYTPLFNSIVYHTTWTSNCVVSIESVVVAYDLKAANGTTAYTLEITESPSLTSIISVQLYLPEYHYVHGNDDTTDHVAWSGYEYYESGGITEASSSWYVPYIGGSGGPSNLFGQWL